MFCYEICLFCLTPKSISQIVYCVQHSACAVKQRMGGVGTRTARTRETAHAVTKAGHARAAVRMVLHWDLCLLCCSRVVTFSSIFARLALAFVNIGVAVKAVETRIATTRIFVKLVLIACGTVLAGARSALVNGNITVATCD